MRGLNEPDTDKFERYFQLVQDEAAKLNSVFFCDAGNGKVFENDSIECEDLWGWLIPAELADEYERLCSIGSRKQFDYDDYFVYVGYEVVGDEIKIRFE